MRLPGELFGAEAQEAFFGHGGEQRISLRRGQALQFQHGAHAAARLVQAFIHRHRILQAFAQHAARGEVQVGEQAVLPRIPQLRAGAGDVGAGQQVKIVEALAVLDERGEGVDHVRIGDVLLLRRHRHAQVLLHQPRHQGGV